MSRTHYTYLTLSAVPLFVIGALFLATETATINDANASDASSSYNTQHDTSYNSAASHSIYGEVIDVDRDDNQFTIRDAFDQTHIITGDNANKVVLGDFVKIEGSEEYHFSAFGNIIASASMQINPEMPAE